MASGPHALRKGARMNGLRGWRVYVTDSERRWTATRRTVALLGVALGCSTGAPDDSDVARGRGLKPIALSTDAEAGVYDAAAHAAFNVEPGLVLLAHPLRLPRTAGYSGGDPVPAALLQALRARGVVQGVCQPMHQAPRDTPRCPGPRAGYIIRASPVMQAGRDTVQVNFAAEAFAPASGARPQALRFEKIYQLVRGVTNWRVVREARVKTE